MHKTTMLDGLNEEQVIVVSQAWMTVDGQEIPLGRPVHTVYPNTVTGRAKLAQELEEPYCSAVMQLWGDTPAIDETAPAAMEG